MSADCSVHYTENGMKMVIFVIPAEAGIQRSGFHALRLNSRFRGDDDLVLSGEGLYGTVTYNKYCETRHHSSRNSSIIAMMTSGSTSRGT
jgi:hypothetical protein